MGNGIAIGVLGFILILGIVMDIAGRDRCLDLLKRHWLQFGTIPSLLSYMAICFFFVILHLNCHDITMNTKHSVPMPISEAEKHSRDKLQELKQLLREHLRVQVHCTATAVTIKVLFDQDVISEDTSSMTDSLNEYGPLPLV